MEVAANSERIRMVFSCSEWLPATCISVFHKWQTPHLAQDTFAMGGGPPSGSEPPQTFDVVYGDNEVAMNLKGEADNVAEGDMGDGDNKVAKEEVDDVATAVDDVAEGDTADGDDDDKAAKGKVDDVADDVAEGDTADGDNDDEVAKTDVMAEGDMADRDGKGVKVDDVAKGADIMADDVTEGDVAEGDDEVAKGEEDNVAEGEEDNVADNMADDMAEGEEDNVADNVADDMAEGEEDDMTEGDMAEGDDEVAKGEEDDMADDMADDVAEGEEDDTVEGHMAEGDDEVAKMTWQIKTWLKETTTRQRWMTWQMEMVILGGQSGWHASWVFAVMEVVLEDIDDLIFQSIVDVRVAEATVIV